MTPGDADFRKSLMKMIYRKLSKTASLPVTCHPQPGLTSVLSISIFPSVASLKVPINKSKSGRWRWSGDRNYALADRGKYSTARPVNPIACLGRTSFGTLGRWTELLQGLLVGHYTHSVVQHILSFRGRCCRATDTY